MCGIFAYVGPAGSTRSIDLDTALGTLRHRGPDDRGTAVIAAAGDTSLTCSFAHTRLSIIDLTSAGHQPMSTPDGRYTIVYNGEIYGFRALRDELQRRGHRFVSQTDTEVVLRGFIEWGEDSVRRLRGMFAFAIWDRERGSLFLARDRLGVKPLYYCQGCGFFAVSSEVRTLLSTNVAATTLSGPSVASFLFWGSVVSPQTLIEGVESFPPAHYGTYDGRELRTTRYWRIPEENDSPTSLEEAAEQIRPVLREAISLELIADVPTGIFLSGGVDSSAIVSVASSASTKPLHTFTVTFDEKQYSEEFFAAEIARIFSCDHHQIRLSPVEAARHLDAAVKALDQPSMDGLNTYFVCKAARDSGLAVALSGLGGDEVFAGYPGFRNFARLCAFGRLGRAMPSSLIASIHRIADHSEFGIRTGKLLSLLNARGHKSATYATMRSLFTDAQVRDLILNSVKGGSNGDDILGWDADDAGSRVEDSQNTYSRLELDHYLLNTLLRDTDAMSMAHSLEVRVPLLDHDLVEATARIPGSLKVAFGLNKPLLVSAASPLPRNTVRRPKMGFGLPLDLWFRGPLKQQVANLLFDHGSAISEFINRQSVERLWTAFLRGHGGVTASRLWALAALNGWCHLHRISNISSGNAGSSGSQVNIRRLREPVSTPYAKPIRVLAMFPELAPYGGIQHASMQLVKAIDAQRRWTLEERRVIVLNDTGIVPELEEMNWVTTTHDRNKPLFVIDALRIAFEARPNAIIVGHLHLSVIAPLLKLVSPKSKIIVVLHGMEAWQRRSAIARAAFRLVAQFTSPSAYTRSMFCAANGISHSKVAVVPWYYEPESESVRDVYYGERAFILAVTRLSRHDEYKGLDVLIAALSRLNGRKLDLVVVGDGPLRQTYERLAETLGISDRVRFLGEVDDATLRGIYRQSEFFVLPSTKEGFGLVYLEAMYHGKPVIGTTKGGQTDIISDGVDGFLVPPLNSDALAARIALLHSDKDLRDNMGAAARRKVVESFNFRAFTDSVTSAIARALDG